MKKNSVSSAFLKNIAYISMLIDHFFAVVFLAYRYQLRDLGSSPETIEAAKEVYDLGRALGRPAFILFAFMAVEGFLHTRSQQKYLIRLGVFALLSEIPFDLAFHQKIFYHSAQNVYFTLFLGVFALCLIKAFQKDLFLQITIVILCCIAAAFLKTDYMFMGVLLIVVLYVCRSSFWYRFIAGSFTIYIGIVLVYMVRHLGEGKSLTACLQSGISELYGILAFIPIYFYNGKKGRQLPKMCYYLFYPLHLLLLYGIKQRLFG